MMIATESKDARESRDGVISVIDTVHFSTVHAAGYEKVKRLCDVAGVILIGILAVPVMLLVALAVKLTSPGPVIFKQRRVGKFGKEFWFYKFRSMTIDAAEIRANLGDRNDHGSQGVTFKMRNDPRTTKVGRFIRKTSLDELPQLCNVLKGDMSFVGPRPALPSEVVRYTPEQRLRLSVTPGLTCYWQVMGRSDLSFEHQVRLDLHYIERRSLWLDLSLLMKTLPAIVTGRGAY